MRIEIIMPAKNEEYVRSRLDRKIPDSTREVSRTESSVRIVYTSRYPEISQDVRRLLFVLEQQLKAIRIVACSSPLDWKK